MAIELDRGSLRERFKFIRHHLDFALLVPGAFAPPAPPAPQMPHSEDSVRATMGIIVDECRSKDARCREIVELLDLIILLVCDSGDVDEIHRGTQSNLNISVHNTGLIHRVG